MEPLRKLWSGIDTVKVNFGVAWSDSFTALLATLDKHKQLAMDVDEPVVFALSASRPFDKVVALHKGSRNARYGVQVEGLTVFFSSRQMPHRDTPNLYVEAGPEYVAQNGLGALYGFVLELIAQLDGQYLWNKVSEIHMTTDIEVDQVHSDADYRQDGEFAFVTRARTKAPRYGYLEQEEEQDQHREGSLNDPSFEDGYASAALFYKGNRLETLQIGKNQMMLRIYDKQAELKRRPRKSWERLLWADPEAQKVLRTEFQVRRESLKAFGFDSIEDVLDRSDQLWAYLTQKWFRLYAKAELSGHSAPVTVYHPFWVAVQEGWSLEALPAVRKKEYRELRLQRAQQLLGHATSLAAITPGQRVVDLEDLFNLMHRLLREMLPEKDLITEIRDKAARFQARNKSDIEEFLAPVSSGPSHVSDSAPPGKSRRGDVIRSPQNPG